MQLLAGILFLVIYLLIILFRTKSLYILYAGVILFLLLGLITPIHALHSINFNVLGIFFGMTILSTLFILSEVPVYIADLVMTYTRNTTIVFLSICGLSGFISIFACNVSTVLIVAPIGLEICKRLKMNPTALLIGISIASNLQGTATLIGDAPSIIMATAMKMNFNDFFLLHNRLGIFFSVQIGAVFSFLVLYFIFKKSHRLLPKQEYSLKVKSWVPTILLILMIINLVFLPYIPFEIPIAYVTLFWALIGVVWHLFSHIEKINIKKDLDWETFIFLIGIFILVETLVNVGVIDSIAVWLAGVSAGNVLFAYVMIIVFSVVISAFVDNVPYTIAMIPVANMLAVELNVSPFLFVFGLILATCLGGNITHIGSTSNVVTMGLLKKNNATVSSLDFIKIGLPFTIAAVLAGTVFNWFVWRY